MTKLVGPRGAVASKRRRLPGAVARMDALEGRRLLATVPTGFVDQSFGTSFGNGTAMAFAPDGRLFTLQQTGILRIIQPDGTGTNALSLTVDSAGERGLLGIAFDPTFATATNKYIYLYYTVPGAGVHNRVSRFTVSGNTVGSESVVVDLDPLSTATNHNGGAMNFGPDGKLYIAVGDNASGANAQSITSRKGKILRLNSDGSIPSDNPTSIAGISGTTSGIYQSIWAAGLRNPYTFSFNPANGQMFINDVGEGTWEEINVGAAGRNYGWPATEGLFTAGGANANYTQPFYTYQHGGGNQLGFAITGGAFYVSNAASQFPAQYQNKYFFGDYVNNWIGYIDPAGPAVTTATRSTAPNFASGTNGVVDLDVGPDGALYYLQRGTTSGVRRILPNPTIAPAISNQPDDVSVSVGQSATFTVEATGQATLSYQWQRNEVDIPGATSASYTRSNVQSGDNNARFRVIVTNSVGTAVSSAARLTVTAANAAPVPTITAPLAGTTYRAGQTYSFSGSATDAEDGTLAASRLSWRIDFHHATHTHPFLAETPGISGGQFTIPTLGEVSADVFYRIYLTATDSAGRSTTVTRDILPETSTFTLATSGIPTAATRTLELDGQPITAGSATLGVVGITRSINAPASIVYDGQTYAFQSWSDGGARLHDIATPENDTTYTAAYKDATAPTRSGNGVFTRDRAAVGRPPHELTFAFSENIIANASALTLLNQTSGQTVPTGSIATTFDTSTHQLRFSFPGFTGGVLPDGYYKATLRATGVTDAAGNVLAGGDAIVNFRVLAGDANDDGVVNFNDLVIVAQTYNLSGRTFAQGNVDYSTDGKVDFGDLTLLAQQYNKTVVPVSPLVTPPAASAPAAPKPIATKKRVAEDVL